MTSERARPPRNVPTLTEVVGWAEPVSMASVDTVRDPRLELAEGALPDPRLPPLPQPEDEPERVPRHDPIELPPLPERDPPLGPEPHDDVPPPIGEDGPKPPPVHAAMRNMSPTGSGPAAGLEPDAARSVPVDQDALRRELLLDLQRRIDVGLEDRVREILRPILVRATDALVRDAGSELSHALHDLVAQSVAQELLRQRSP